MESYTDNGKLGKTRVFSIGGEISCSPLKRQTSKRYRKTKSPGCQGFFVRFPKRFYKEVTRIEFPGEFRVFDAFIIPYAWVKVFTQMRGFIKSREKPETPAAFAGSAILNTALGKWVSPFPCRVFLRGKNPNAAKYCENAWVTPSPRI